MGVKMVNTMDELDQAIKGAGDKPVIIDFYATWCGPCKMIAPKLEAMSNEMPGAVFLKIDVDELGEVAEKYEVSAMPTFVIMKTGVEIARVVGADEKKIRETLQANM